MMDNPGVGQTINRYRIVTLLGEGGMGSVYKAHDLTLQRDVAIKLMHPQYAHQPDFQERFLQEARTAARLDHPSIVQVHDFGQHKGQLYIVMEFIPGDNLGQILRSLRAANQWIPLSETLPLLRQVCLALHYAHQHGVLHRDIKPDNIMLKPEPADGLPYRPVITDLGLAKLAEGGLLTQEGTSMGTPAYMSPEQASGKPTGPASDVYSLGVLLFELATGRLPFTVKSLPEAIRYHTQEAPPSPRSIRPDLPESLEKVILKALQKDPTLRYSSANDLASAIEAAMPLIKPITGQPTTIGDTVSLVTQYQKSLMEARGPSIIQEMQPAAPSRLDTIQVLKDGKTTSYPIQKAEITIGRDITCDIQLDDAKVSRNHARVEFEDGAVYITDLNSTNGTFLENTHLLPGVREPWSAEQLVRIGSHWLRLVRAVEQPARILGTLAQEPAGRPAPVSSVSSQIAMNIQQAVYTVESGGTVAVPVSLVNQGSIVDHFRFQLSGLPEAWIAAPLPRQHMLPGERLDTSLQIRPPRSPSAREGNYPVQLTLVSESSAQPVASASFSLQILPFAQFASELHPEKIRAGTSARITITNQGNAPEQFTMKFKDRADALAFQASQSQIELGGGQSAEMFFTARPVQPRWFGAEQTLPFTVQVRAVRGEQRIHSGEIVQRALIPSWAPAVLLTLCMTLALAAFLGFNQIQARASQQATQTSQAALAALMMAQTATVMPTSAPTISPTQAAPPTEAPTATPAPSETFVPSPTVSNLSAAIVLPDAGQANLVTKALVFQVKANDPAVGSEDGAGITNVTLRIFNPDQKLVHEQVEQNAPYCGFGGNTPDCPAYHFANQGNTWNSGDRVMDGDYVLQAVVQAADGRSLTLEGKVRIERLDRILFISERDGSRDLYSIYEDGSDLTRMTQQMAVECCLTWSPDGRQFAFVAKPDGNLEIYIAEADGSDLVNLTQSPAQDYFPSWSPDGEQIAFLSTRGRNDSTSDVYLINKDGSDLKQLAATNGNDGHLAWAPDGSRLSFSSDLGDGNWDIFTIQRNGSNLVQLTNDPFYDAAASWSKDGSRIAFISSRVDRTFMPHIMAADGSGQALLVNAPASGIITRWTPDGKKIVFLTAPNNGNTGIFTVNPDGSDLTRVTNPIFSTGLFDWRTAGDYLVFMHGYDIYVISQDGSLSRNLTNSNNVIDDGPVWQP